MHFLSEDTVCQSHRRCVNGVLVLMSRSSLDVLCTPQSLFTPKEMSK